MSESVPFWLTVKNSGSSSVTHLLLVQYPDSEYSLCLKNKAAGSCDASVGAGSELLPELFPNQSYTMWGELKPKSKHASEKLVLILRWNISNSTQSFAAVPLGENKVLGRWDFWWDAWLGDLAKTLAVPAALSLLVFALDLLTKRREARQRKKEEDEAKEEALKIKLAEEHKQQREKLAEEEKQRLEKQKAEAEAERLRKQIVATETWKQMLPISHRYAAKFYLPLSSTAQDAVDAFEEPNAEAAFFYTLLLLKRIDLAKDSIGGLYFKNYAGEELAQLCWRSFRNKFLGKDTNPFSAKMQVLSQSIDLKIKFGKFQSDLQGSGTSEIAEAFQMFAAKMTKMNTKLKHRTKSRLDLCLNYLRGFYVILDFESNRPYEYWYDSKAELKATGETETREIIDFLKKLGERKKIKDAQKYFQEIDFRSGQSSLNGGN